MYSVLPALTATLFLSLGVIVYKKSKRTWVSISYIILCICTFFWQLSWAFLFQTNNLNTINILIKVGYSFIVFIPPSFYHYLSAVSHKKSEYKFIYLSYTLFSILLLLTLSTSYIISGNYLYFFGYYPKAGMLHPLFLFFTNVVAIRGLYIIFKTSKIAKGKRKKQLTYSLIGLLIYFLASVDFLCNYGFEFYPPGVIFIVIALGIIGYSILKHNLMDARIVLTKTSATIINSCFFAILYFFLDFALEYHQIQGQTQKIIYLLYALSVGIFFTSTKNSLTNKASFLKRKIQSQENDIKQAEKIKKELQMAAKVQQSLLPHQMPDIHPLKLDIYFNACREVSGDFYDIYDLKDGRYAISIVDITGKGVAAAMMMTHLKATLKKIVSPDLSPKEVLETFNSILCHDTTSKGFVPIVYAIVNPNKSQVTFSNSAMHVFYKQKETTLIENNNPILGLSSDSTLEETTLTIKPKDLFVACSDGVIDAKNINNEMIGEKNMSTMINQCNNSPIETLQKCLQTFTKGAEQNDDITILTISNLLSTSSKKQL